MGCALCIPVLKDVCSDPHTSEVMLDLALSVCMCVCSMSNTQACLSSNTLHASSIHSYRATSSYQSFHGHHKRVYAWCTTLHSLWQPTCKSQ